ncbi:uncharacterized protein LOC136062310, partial [Quercus suber]|uniref:uncharacterized protein LOC136062310 n=1 Tax=Quercus suber TaxID=58331 RepID=UPI0032DEA308
MDSAASILSDFQKQYSYGISVPRQRHGKWEPPSAARKWKTNFDGAMFSESDQAGIGVVIRNHEGQVMAALSEKIKKPASAEILEALAARRAVNFTMELGFNQSMFEGDSEVIIKALNAEDFSLASVGHIIKDIWSMSGLLQTKSFPFVRRQGNSVAHALAQRARFSFPVLIWMEDVPPDIYRF